MTSSTHPVVDRVAEKLAAGKRLSQQDALDLFDPAVPLNQLGQLAHEQRRRLNGRAAYYNINVHLNPTNVCVYRCVFCAFRADLRDPRGYVMDDEQILARAEEARRIGATEMHIVGGLHHQRKYEWYVHLIRMLHQAHPQLHLKAWTAVEIHWFCHMTGYSYQRVLEEMIEAGLGSMPGGGAEIFHPEVRHQICEHKADAQCWLDIHRTAHRLGLRTTCTMLYGHIEKPHHRVDHLFRLRALQDETGGFLTFIPLAFHPENTGLAHLKKPSVLDDLRTMAISRLVLDNVPHIKAYWVMLGLGTAQAALSYGADDFDGTVRHERIYHDAGADTPQALDVETIRHLIREAGCVPIERDTLYRRVERQGTQWQLAAQEPDSARVEHLASLAPAASYGG